MSTDTPGTLADFDREYDAKTLAIATCAPGSAAVAAVLGIPDDDVTYPFAFGMLRERARVTLERLAAAEARVAELEAERDAYRDEVTDLRSGGPRA